MGSGSVKRPIGILGGMGPEATILLMSRVLALTPAQDDSDHVPLLVDSNTQVPSRIKALIDGTGESPGPVLVEMTRRLGAMGAMALAMPCNTAHAYLPEIRAAAGDVPLLDMVGLTAERFAGMTPRPQRVALLASTAVQITGLYDKAFASLGIEAIFPQRQAEVMEVIRAVKRGACGPSERAVLADIAEALIDQGAEAIAIACTEISVIADGLPRTVSVLDAIDVLADAIVGFSEGQNAALRSGAAA